MSDPSRAGSGRYPAVAILLHWLIAAAIVVQVALASRMHGPPTPQNFAVTQLHKSVGLTILLLSLARVGWRLLHPPPPLPDTLAPWERMLARLTHVGFYGVMIGMPLTGWMMVSTSRIGVPTRLYGRVPWPDIPGLGALAPPVKAAWNAAAMTAHESIIIGGYVLLALHVAGALKHQLLSRDEPVLARMAPGAVPGRWREPRLALIAAGAAGAVAFGLLVQPPRPHVAPPPGAVHEHAAHEHVAPEAPPAAALPPQASEATHEPTPQAVRAPAEPVRWIVAPGSTLGFTTAWSGEAVEGRFARWTADIRFHPEALDRSQVTVRIDVASAETGDGQRDAALATEDWFDAAAHPQAVFTASRFEQTGADRYVAHGRLSLRGVSRPLDLPFRLNIAGDRADVRGVTSLDRTTFGIGQGEWTSTDQIPAKVTVSVRLNARRG